MMAQSWDYSFLSLNPLFTINSVYTVHVLVVSLHLSLFLGVIVILMDNRYRHTGRIAVVWQRGFVITWDFGHFGAFFVSLFLGLVLSYTWLRLPPHLACPAVADDKYDELAYHVWNLTANFTELVNRLNRRLALPSDNQAISSWTKDFPLPWPSPRNPPSLAYQSLSPAK